MYLPRDTVPLTTFLNCPHAFLESWREQGEEKKTSGWERKNPKNSIVLTHMVRVFWNPTPLSVCWECYTHISTVVPASIQWGLWPQLPSRHSWTWTNQRSAFRVQGPIRDQLLVSNDQWGESIDQKPLLLSFMCSLIGGRKSVSKMTFL